MKAMLLFPPNWTPSMPHLALPSLTAYLRPRGVEVIQRDLNAEVFDHILTAGYLRASLERYAPAHTHSEAFGITRVIERPEADLGFYFDYEVAEGMDPAMADLVMNRFIDSLPVKPYPQFYCNDVYRFLYAAHLSETGAPSRPPWLAAPALT